MPGRGFLFHILDFYSSGDVSVGLEWLGAGGGGSIEHKGQEDVSRLLLAVSTHTVGKTFKYKYKYIHKEVQMQRTGEPLQAAAGCIHTRSW